MPERHTRTGPQRSAWLGEALAAGLGGLRVGGRCLLIAAVLILAFQKPALALTGDPPVMTLHPPITVKPHNFGAAQDDQSVLYLANDGGVVSFDGEHWDTLPLPNGDLAGSISYDGHGRLYVGGYDLFGYLRPDATGQLQFTDLTRRFASQLRGESFGEVWQVLVCRQGVFFMATNYAFFFDPADDTASLIRYAGRFGAAAVLGNDVVLQFRGEGLRRFRNGGWEVMPGTAVMRDLLFGLVPLPDGGLLGISTDGHWHQLATDGTVNERPMPPGFPPSSQFNAGILLSDDTMAFAGIDGSLWLYDPHRNSGRSVHVTTDSLTSLLPARDGGLFAISDLAVFHIQWPSSWTLIGKQRGISGEVHRLRRWGRRWLALSDNGVYAADANAETTGSHFSRQPWTDNDAWDLLPLDDRHALLAESYRLLLISEGQARELVDHDLYPRRLLRSRFNDGRIYVVTDFGLAMLAGHGTDWRLALDRGTQELNPTSVVELSADELLLATQRDGVLQLRLSPDGTRIEQQRKLQGPDGIRYGTIATAIVSMRADGSVIASTSAGVFRWNGGRFEAIWVKGLDAVESGLRTVLEFAAAPDGSEWAFGDDRIYERHDDVSWHASAVESILNGFVESIAFDEDRAVLFGGSSQILRFGSNGGPSQSSPPKVLLRSIEKLGPGNERQRLDLAPATPPSFTQGDFSIAFRFAAPEYEAPHTIEYSARLKGHDDEYQDWRSSTLYTYRHLEPGNYSFSIRARDKRGHLSQIEVGRFIILPPWYARRGMLLLWAALLAVSLAGTMAGVAAWRTRRLRATAAHLERMVADRTKELESANRRLHDMAHLDGLTAVANRRRLDDWLQQAWAQCGDHGRPLAVMIIDVDHFKSYNDRMGHLAGDELLKQVVEALSGCLRRADDLVARYGGDEFVAVLPGADVDKAQSVAETMRRRVRETVSGASVSIGVAARIPRTEESVAQLLSEADEALYRSKQDGRNCVRVFRSEG